MGIQTTFGAENFPAPNETRELKHLKLPDGFWRSWGHGAGGAQTSPRITAFLRVCLGSLPPPNEKTCWARLTPSACDKLSPRSASCAKGSPEPLARPKEDKDVPSSCHEHPPFYLIPALLLGRKQPPPTRNPVQGRLFAKQVEKANPGLH